MIPAEARWVVQNIYLPTTNCSSFSQIGIKDRLSCYIYIFFFLFCLLYLPFLYRPAGETHHAQPLLSFSHTTNFSFVVSLEPKQVLLSYHRPFLLRGEKTVTAFALVQRKMRCIKEEKRER